MTFPAPAPFVYAKKLRLPSSSAHVLQSLNMALAFSDAGVGLRCFPGCLVEAGFLGSTAAGREAVLRAALRSLGREEAPSGWTPLPGGHKGRYGLHFRWNILKTLLVDPRSVCYARDLGEMRYLRGLNRLRPLRLVYEAHEILSTMQRAEGKAGWEKTRERERDIFSVIQGLVTTNPQIAEEARRDFGYAGPVLVAPNGYAPSLFHPLALFSENAPWPGEDQPVRLVYVGAFHPGKGVRTLLDALASLPERFCLRLVGGNPASALEGLRGTAQRLGLGARLELYGSVAPQAVRAACAGAHIFVLPQQSAFFFSPLKLYEAMAMGLPIVTSHLPLFAPHAEAGRALAAPGPGKEGLAATILCLARSPELAARLRERALQEAPRHTWLQRARAIVRFVQETCVAKHDL